MEAHNLAELKREWDLEDLNPTPPLSPTYSPPPSYDDDGWLFPQPNSNEESRVRYPTGPERDRLFESFAGTYAKISRALIEAEQRKYASLYKRGLTVRSSMEKNQQGLLALPSIASSGSAGAATPTADLIPSHKSILAVDNTKEERGHRKDREAPKEDSREDLLKGGKIPERGMARRLEEEDAAVGKKPKITTLRDFVGKIVDEVMEARKAMEDGGGCDCNKS